MKQLVHQIKYFLGDNVKDGISNLISLLLVIGETINQTVIVEDGKPINWGRLSLVVAIAVLGWLNGKSTNLKSPPAPQHHEDETPTVS